MLFIVAHVLDYFGHYNRLLLDSNFHDICSIHTPKTLACLSVEREGRLISLDV